jgi:DegV family protein with EDD domain
VTVRIVTDSSVDLTRELAAEYGITIVPAYVNFGKETYRDGVDISPSEIYERLMHGNIHPTTAQATPADFAKVYQDLAKEADEIISIHMSVKFSGYYRSAQQGAAEADVKSHITVIDSATVSMALGIICMSAARLGQQNADISVIMDDIKDSMKNTHLMATLDTLKYLAMGGRIGKAKALLGSILNVKPIVTVRDGELAPSGNMRTRAKAIEKLYEFVAGAKDIKEIAVVHNTTPGEANALRDRFVSLVPADRLHVTQFGPAMGIHTGPGTMVVAVRDSGGKAAEIEAAAQEKKPMLHMPKLNLPSRH